MNDESHGGALSLPRDLVELPLRTRHRHVVGHLEDELTHRGAELALDLFRRRVRILDRVVKEGRLQHLDVIYAADRGDEGRHFDRMVDVWRLMVALSPLVAVLEGGEAQGLEKANGRQWRGSVGGWERMRNGIYLGAASLPRRHAPTLHAYRNRASSSLTAPASRASR